MGQSFFGPSFAHQQLGPNPIPRPSTMVVMGTLAVDPMSEVIVDNTDPEQVWLMVYTHPREEVQPMSEAEWHGLYGNPELAE